MYDYYKQFGKGIYARRIRASILNQLQLVRKNPEMGKKVTALNSEKFTYRALIEENYKVVYRIGELDDEKIIFVTDVFDTRQDPDKFGYE